MVSYPTIIVNTLSIVVLLLILFVAWRRRKDVGAKELLTLSIFMLIWAIGSFGESLANGLAAKTVWRNFTQIGVFGTPVAILIFTIAFSGILHRWVVRIGALLFAVQASAVLFILTDSFHHQARGLVRLVRIGGIETLSVETTVWTRIFIAMNFIYLLIALALLLFAFLVQEKRRPRAQIICVLLGLVAGAVYSYLKVSTDGFLNAVPISGVFALSGSLVLFGIFRYDILMLAPIARNEVFQIVGSAILVARNDGSLVDMNRAAMTILGIPAKERAKEPDLHAAEVRLLDLLPNWTDIDERSPEEFPPLRLEVGEDVRYFTLDRFPVKTRSRKIGCIGVLRDTTEQKKNMETLKYQADHDGLTGALNRRTFIESAEKMIHDTGKSDCLLFIDIDHFKKVNDEHGHIAGDTVLAEVCRRMVSTLPDEALLGRMGGEEFAVFLSNLGVEESLVVANRLRTAIRDSVFLADGRELRITVSVGVACGSFRNFDAMYGIADANVLLAKAEGRNGVRI